MAAGRKMSKKESDFNMISLYVFYICTDSDLTVGQLSLHPINREQDSHTYLHVSLKKARIHIWSRKKLIACIYVDSKSEKKP